MIKAPNRRTPKGKIIPDEHSEQVALVQWLDLKRIDYFAVPNANAMSSLSPTMAIRLMAKLKKEGFKSGVSDIVVLLPNKIIFLEMKRQSGGVQSDTQKQFQHQVNKYPYAEYYLAKGFQNAKDFLEQEQKNS